MDLKISRKERIMNLKEAETLLRRASVGRLGSSLNDVPYIVPVNFVYNKGRVYFHGAGSGRKIGYITKNPNVCFEVDEFIGLKKGERPCSFGTYYRSAIIFGEARIILELDDKKEVLKRLVKKYGKIKPIFDEEELRKVEIIEILIKEITSKKCLPQ